jgi:hypothetical protein
MVPKNILGTRARFKVSMHACKAFKAQTATTPILEEMVGFSVIIGIVLLNTVLRTVGF